MDSFVTRHFPLLLLFAVSGAIIAFVFAIDAASRALGFGTIWVQCVG